MPDPAGATPPLDEAGCARAEGLPGLGAGSLPQRGDHHQPGAGGLAGPGPPDRRRRAEPGRGRRVRRPSARPVPGRAAAAGAPVVRGAAGLAGRPPAGDAAHPAPPGRPPTRPTCWPRCGAPPPCRPPRTPGAGRTASLAACITYSYAHLSEQTRRLLPAVSLFHGVADEDLLTALLRRRGGAGPVRRGQQAGVDGGAGGRGPGRAAHRPRRRACTGSTRPCPATSPPDGTPRTPPATARSGRRASRPCAPPAPRSAGG